MHKNKSLIFLVSYAALLILLLYGLVEVLSSGGRYFFLLEFIGLLALLILSLAGFVFYESWGKPLFFAVFSLYLLNLALVWYFKENFYLVLMVLALIGLVLSFPRQKKRAPKKKEELHSMIFEEPKVDSKTESKPATTYSPAKYVASKNSNVYHEPKCEWAKKIEKSRQLWFDDKKDAVEKGFRKHDCVQ